MRRQTMATLLRTLREPVALVDLDDRVLAATDTWLRLMDQPGPADAPVTAMCKARFGVTAARRILVLVRRAFEHSGPQTAEVPIDPSGGRILVTCTPLRHPDEEAVEEVVVAFNGTDGLAAPRGLTPASATTVTPREHEVLLLLAEGLSIPSIAHRLHIGQATVRGHLKSLLQKLQAHTQLQAVLAGMRAGLVPVPQ